MKKPKAKLLTRSLRIQDSRYIGDHTYKCGHRVPIFEVSSVHALNQLIGHAKFNNSTYGSILYRGECRLYETLIPSLFRNCSRVSNKASQLTRILNKIMADNKMCNNLKLDLEDTIVAKAKTEGLLQHYGIPTRYLDVVDNHWVALWMGLHESKLYGKRPGYYHYTKRELPLGQIAEGLPLLSESLYQYIVLIAVPYSSDDKRDGVICADRFICVDLRQSLPSVFLRPHAQHGLVVRKKLTQELTPSDYDMATEVVGILKVRIDIAGQWLGSGDLLTQDNLFPPPSYDQGYEILLMRDDLFDSFMFRIAKYV